jgi:transposase-like protein
MKTAMVPGPRSWKTSVRWTATEARAAVEALRRSGEAVTVFAARHGVAAHRLYGARRRLSATEGSAERREAPVFVEIAPPVIGAPGAVFEVVLARGDIVRVPSHFDETSLRSVLAAVRGTAC